MTVFKGFLKILNKCKGIVIMYTVMLLFFGGFTISTSDENSVNFSEDKPDILIINNDENSGITKNLISYIKENSNIIKIDNDEEKINDALFYRDINYVIYIPKNYRIDFLDNKNPKIEIKKVNDYNSSYANMILEKYLKVANIYKSEIDNENILIEKINDTLDEDVNVNITEKQNKSSLERMTFYYNFCNYSLLASIIYIVCLILSSFKNEKISKRTIISSMNYKKYNRILLLSSMLFAVCLWILYVILSFILIGDTLITLNGLGYIINSFVFTICALVIALFIGNLVTNKNAINGIVNVVALGSSFLCGSFVPVEFLPDSVLTVAHIFPSYYFIQNNEMLEKIKITSFGDLSKLFPNILIMITFIVIFIVIINIISKNKRKIG
ncbi:MAG: ABC transporter permease [Bacilli bacterium]|nr:ABC transporter permease [Bacilli bacterium]